jgi:hypothetical protein
MTLWILFCRMTKDMDILFAFYASDRDDAEQQAQGILQEHPYERLDLKEYRCGFRILLTHLPGVREGKTL